MMRPGPGSWLGAGCGPSTSHLYARPESTPFTWAPGCAAGAGAPRSTPHWSASGALPSDREVPVAEAGHPGRVEAVAAVEHDRRAHQAGQLAPVQVEILGPLGHQHHRVAVVEDLVDRR